MVESQPSKLLVAGSIPVSRSILPSPLKSAGELRMAATESGSRRNRAGRRVGSGARDCKADVAQLAERVLGKDEVTSSILVIGSIWQGPGLRLQAARVQRQLKPGTSPEAPGPEPRNLRAERDEKWRRRNLIVRNRT